MADVQVGYSKSTGKHFVKLPGNLVQEVTAEQAAQVREDPGFVSNFIGSAGEMAKNTLLGGAALLAPGEYDRELAQQGLVPSNQELAARGMVSPVSTLAGQAAPAVAVGAATMGAGLPATVGAEALLGAAQSPDAPLEGAAIGGAFGLVPFAGQGARAAAQSMGRMLPNAGAAGESLRTAAGVVPSIERTMKDRVMNTLSRVEGEGAQKPPILSGYLTPDELDNAGIPYTRGDVATLMARTPDEMTRGTTIRNMEELQRSGPFGASTNTIRDQQKTSFTGLIKRELGIGADDARALTDTRMGEVFQGLGSKFDEYVEQAGPRIKLPDGAIDDLRAIMANAEPDSAARIAKVVEGIIGKTEGVGAVPGKQHLGGANGTFITQTSLKDAERVLGNMIDVGINHGNYAMLSDATAIRQMLRQAVEESAIRRGVNPNIVKEMQELRKQYALASALVRRGVRDPAGEINASSLRNSWNLNPNYSKKQIGQTDLGRALETAAYLTSRVVPSSGTGERLMANMPNAALKAVPGVGMAALGIEAVFGR